MTDTTQTQQPSWWVMDGVPGQGERPAYLKEKYGYNMAKQASAYPDAERALGATSGAPDQYDLSQFQGSIDIDNPYLKDYMDWAKQNRINQEAFNKTLDTFISFDKSHQPDLAAEKAKLGPDADKRIETVKNWMENNFDKRYVDAWHEVATKAEVIEFLDEIRQRDSSKSSQPPAPQSIDTAQHKILTVKEVQNELEANYKKYREDKNYQDEISRKFKQALGE